MFARQIIDEGLKVTFAMSCLAGRAKMRAYKHTLHDLSAFPSYESFKTELKRLFELPKNESYRRRYSLIFVKSECW
uniref:Uncharacterized protein n=1 Tax=Globisporangium ultimum (strain ATCC 200006 / CBS 805.95 / DAOM BR144) TaxID=431595 RepID=K3X210_GLOUD